MKNIKKYRRVIIVAILAVFYLITGIVTDNFIPWTIAACWTGIVALDQYIMIGMKDSIESVINKHFEKIKEERLNKHNPNH